MLGVFLKFGGPGDEGVFDELVGDNWNLELDGGLD